MTKIYDEMHIIDRVSSYYLKIYGDAPLQIDSLVDDHAEWTVSRYAQSATDRLRQMAKGTRHD